MAAELAATAMAKDQGLKGSAYTKFMKSATDEASVKLEEYRELMGKVFSVVICVFFCIIKIEGWIDAYIRIDVKLNIELCMPRKDITLTLIPIFTIVVDAGVQAEICPIAKGRIGAGGDIIGISFEPTMFINMADDFSITAQMDLVIYPLKLCAYMSRWFMDFKWCCTKGWIKICIPCGFTWGSENKWDIGCVTLGDWTSPHRIPLFPKDRKRNIYERSAPKPGVIYLTQKTNQNITIDLPGFLEEETTVTLTEVWIIAKTASTAEERALERAAKQSKIYPRNHIGKAPGKVYLNQRLMGCPVTWSGQLQNDKSLPVDGKQLHGTPIQACVEATNTEGLSAYACSKTIVWDAMPPLVKAMRFVKQTNYTLLGIREYDVDYTLGSPKCKEEKSPRLSFEDCDPVIISSGRNFLMQVDVFEQEFKTIVTAGWTVRSTKKAAWDDGQKPYMEDMGEREQLLDDTRNCYEAGKPCKGSEANPWTLPLEGFPVDVPTGFQYKEGTKYYVSILMCDPHSNCAWTYSPPIMIDRSPGGVLVDVNMETRRNTSANGIDKYLLYGDSLSFNWTMRLPTGNRENYYMAFRLWHLLGGTAYRELLWLGKDTLKQGLMWTSSAGKGTSQKVTLPLPDEVLTAAHLKKSDNLTVLEKDYGIWSSPVLPAECPRACNPKPQGGGPRSCSQNNPCLGKYFCNFDNGDLGFCESCDTCSDCNTCALMNSNAVTSCNSKCTSADPSPFGMPRLPSMPPPVSTFVVEKCEKEDSGLTGQQRAALNSRGFKKVEP